MARRIISSRSTTTIEHVSRQPKPVNGISSPRHLKEWLGASGRQFIVLDSNDLVDSLPWPGGVETLMLLIDGYRQHRNAQVLSSVECQACNGSGKHPATQGPCPICRGVGSLPKDVKNEALSLEEWDELLKWATTEREREAQRQKLK